MRQAWHHNPFRDLINFTKNVEICEFRMNVMDFGEIRKFGRDHIDIVNGLTFYIYGILISCDRTTGKDLVLALDGFGDIISHAMRREYSEGEDPFTFHRGCPSHGLYPDCGPCTVHRIMDS